MVAEKNIFSLILQMVISECKNDKPRRNKIRKVSAPPSFKKTCIYTILPPPFLNFSYAPLWGIKSKCTSSPLNKGVGGSELWVIGIHSVTLQKWTFFYFLQ